jgi:hypothetical protein
MTIDNTQRTALLVATGVTIGLIFFTGAEGFPRQFRQLNIEMWLYALAQSMGTSFICLFTYIAFAIADIFQRRNRIGGWLLCSAVSVALIFIVLYILPPPKSLF